MTGLDLAPEALDAIGHNVTGVERMINHRLGVRREHDTLPDRWFEEPLTAGPYAGERIDRAEFDRMLTRFYDLSDLDEAGLPRRPWRGQLEAIVGA